MAQVRGGGQVAISPKDGWKFTCARARHKSGELINFQLHSRDSKKLSDLGARDKLTCSGAFLSLSLSADFIKLC